MFPTIIEFVLQHEGGYCCVPNDPGGETNWGIAKSAHPNLDIKNLTKDQAIAIYAKEYWNPQWESLGLPLAAAMLDTAVNMGPKVANYFLQNCNKDYVQYLQLRIARYKFLTQQNPNLQKFFQGWMNRVTDLRRFIEVHKDDKTNSVPPTKV
jgi:lysozyme family protein